MKRCLTGLVLGVVLLAGIGTSRGSEPSDESIRILQTGSFHGEEVQAGSGEQWLGLYADEYGFLLRPVTLQVDTVYDPVVDADPGKPSGKRVSVAGEVFPDGQGCKALGPERPLLKLNSQQPILLLQGIEAPRTGRLQQGGSTPRLFIYPGQVLDFDLGDRYYHLMAYGDAKEDNIIHQYRLLLWEEDQSFPVLRIENLALFESAKPQVLWVGDLNGDQHLDLLLERSDHYNVSDQVLFLSGEGVTLKEVASFRTTGC